MKYYPGEILTPLIISKEATFILSRLNPRTKPVFEVIYKSILGDCCEMTITCNGETRTKIFQNEDLKCSLDYFSKKHIEPLVYSMNLATDYILCGQVNFIDRLITDVQEPN